MQRRLPPLNSLRAFEAAARHLSFKAAAEELHVTPAAVSQQVKALEDYYGVQLFVRLTRALQLTETGQAAQPALKEGFSKLDEAASAIANHTQSGVLTVSVPPSFGAKWLVPRLDRFSAAHPDYELRIDATDALVDFGAGGVDVGLRYGRGLYDGLSVERLMSEVAFPVCCPALAEGDPPLRRPEDLVNHTLLHVRWKMEAESAPNWRMWLRAAGVEGVDPEPGPRFSVENLALQAAIEGHGVALVSSALVAGDLKAGRLVRPFAPATTEATAFSYYLVYPPAGRADPKVQAFRQWILEEVAAADAPQ